MDQIPFVNQHQVTLKQNGVFRTPPQSAFTSITAQWRSDSIPPAGTLTFAVDGDVGTGGNTIDLGAGQRTLNSNTPLAFVDITVSGLPAGAAVTLYFR